MASATSPTKGGTPGQVILAGLITVIILLALIVSPLCYDVIKATFLQSPREPLSAAELRLLQEKLGITLPAHNRSIQTFVEHYHGFPAKLIVRITSPADDAPEFKSAFWQQCDTPATCRDGDEWETFSGPAWSKPVLLRDDVVYRRADGARARLNRNKSSTILWVQAELAPSETELLSVLTRFPWRDEPAVLGPPPTTGEREWCSPGASR